MEAEGAGWAARGCPCASGWAGRGDTSPYWLLRPGLDSGSCQRVLGWQVHLVPEDGETRASLQLLPEPSSYFPFLGSVTGRLGPAWPGKGRKRLALGRVLSCGPPLWPSLPVTSSFKSAGLFQGLGKTAKKSRGPPPFRADLSSLSCGEKAPSRGLAKPPNCTANTNQSRRARPRAPAGPDAVRGDSGPCPYLVLHQPDD